MLYVTDLTAFGKGAVIRVNPNNGQQSLVATGGLINGPNVLTFVNGSLYVANEGDGTGTVHNIIRVDTTTGGQTLITSGPGFTVPTGMVPAPGNSAYLADEPGGFTGPGSGAVSTRFQLRPLRSAPRRSTWARLRRVRPEALSLIRSAAAT